MELLLAVMDRHLLLHISLLMLFTLSVNCSEAGPNDDVLALIVFKSSLHDPDSKLVSWNEEDDTPCNWFGVKCHPKNDRVSELLLDGLSLTGHINRGLLRLNWLRVLSLSNNNLNGSINSGIGRLWRLTVINLANNNLSGQIPFELFAQCGFLKEFYLAGNHFTGQIPDTLTSCSNLERLDLSSNLLTGEIPYKMWSLNQLRSLDLSDNFLEGQILDAIGNLKNLISVALGKNKFSGSIPVSISNCSLLEFIDFSENQISGVVPDSVRKLGMLSSLDLHGNALESYIPDWIGGIESLASLDLSANKFSGNIPNSLGHLQSLKSLNLSRNGLTGPLSDSLKNCTNLQDFDVSQNSLTGNLGAWFSGIAVQSVRLSHTDFDKSVGPSYIGLRTFDVSSNGFSGEIPSGIGSFNDLQLLNMSGNSFTGSIPASIAELSNMFYLDLSHNQLTGSIPFAIGKATSLKELRLAKNHLTGAIPVQIQNCSSLTVLIMSQNNLTGPVPEAIASLINLQNVDLSSNSLSGSLPLQLANLPHLVGFNISNNYLEGEIPAGGFFNNIPLSSISGNPALCGAVVNVSCPVNHPKPLVFDPNSSSPPNVSSMGLDQRHKSILSISSLIAIGAAVLIAIGVITVSLLNIHVRANMLRSATAINLSGGDKFSCSPTPDANYGKLVMFSGDSNNFVRAQGLLNKSCEIGSGGFGIVYRACLEDGSLVAIKKLNTASLTKCQEDFEREVQKLGKAQHSNVVSLEGYYWTASLQLLIYKYVSGGNLHRYLHDTTEENILSWRQRFKIILSMAKGLAYLHESGIIHYNIKSSNILIDSTGEPKVADYGLANLLPVLDHCVLSSKIQSSLGYVAPEFSCRTVKITEKCDIYSFGILVLEIVTGKVPVEYVNEDVLVLCDLVRAAFEEGRVEECIDKKLDCKFPAEEVIQVIKVGLICASQVPSKRPDMAEVVNILELIQCPSEEPEEIQ
ncbi:unnamed protein product [Rhodiola kirilowii]